MKFITSPCLKQTKYMLSKILAGVVAFFFSLSMPPTNISPYISGKKVKMSASSSALDVKCIDTVRVCKYFLSVIIDWPNALPNLQLLA